MNKIQKIKQHVRDNKAVYIVGGTCLVLGAGITYTIMKTKPHCLAEPALAELPRSTEGPVFSVSHNSGTVVQNNGSIIYGGYMKKLVQNLESGDIYGSVAQAAEEAGVDVSKMSRHLNGHMEHVNGSQWRIVGISTDAA